MNILIDTNILIPLEDTGRELDPLMAKMRQLSQQQGHSLCIHPAQRGDIARDVDESRKQIVLSRLNQYEEIPSPPILTETDIKNYGWSQNNENDRIDNLLLHAVNRGAVHLLVTNDRKIHSKARQSQIQEQVHYPDQFVAYLRAQTKQEESPPSGIEEIYLHEVEVSQPFFDSLRESYREFDSWYKKKGIGKTKSLVCS